MGNLGNYPASPKHRQFIRWLGVKNITTYLFLLILGLILENAGYGMLIPVINIIADGSQQNISIGPITVVGGITPIIAFVIVLVTLRAVIALSTVRFGAFLTGDWHNRMRVHLHNQLHCPSGVETHSHKTGEIVNTVVGETWSASEYCRHFLVMISRLIALFTYVAILLWLSLEMTLGLLFFVSPVVLFAYLLNRRTREIGKTILNLNNDLYDTAIASVSARFTIIVYGLEDRFRSKFSKISKQILNNEIKSTWYGSIIPEISSLIVIPVIIGLTMYAKAQEMPIGEIVVFSLILFRAVPQANSVLRDFSGLARHRASFDKIRASMVPWNQKEDHRTKRHLEDIKLLELDHISFKFPNSRPIITDFNALLSTGNVYQLNGISGSGKSTVISIILGVIKPDVGSIRINNIPLQELNHEEFRSQIGYAGQQSAIFESSIQNNIELWRQVNKFRLQQIGKMLSIDKISAELKDGYNTHLGVGGVSISGGQKQRICIARAIAMNPSIIILDEATSELDIDAEQSVLNAIYDLCPKSIILIVSHRIEAHTQNNNICITHREDINPTTDADY